jgi:imidazolonepropionase-like amidohydrolase
VVYEPVRFEESYLPEDDSLVMLRNGRVYDVNSCNYYEPGTALFIRGDRIELVSRSSAVREEFAPDYVIDLGGKTVLPTFFNTHCHSSITSPLFFPSIRDALFSRKLLAKQLDVNMTECLARGITNIREAYTEDMRLIWALKERMACGGLKGPRIMQSVVVGPTGSYMAEKYDLASKLLGAALGAGQSDHTKDYAGVLEFPVEASESQVRDCVDEAIDVRGAKTIKIGDQSVNVMNPKKSTLLMKMDQLCVLVDQARKRNIPTMMHHLSLESFRRGVQAGVGSLSHAPADGLLTDEDVRAFKAAGCMIEPTCSVLYGVSWKISGNKWFEHPDMQALSDFREHEYTFDDLAKEYFIPEFRASIQKSYERFTREKFKMFGMDVTPMLRYYADFMYVFENTRILFNHDVDLALANDAGAPPIMPSMMKLELDLLGLITQIPGVNRQLTPHDAIRIATINSARSMGLEEEFGTIETGKIADLAIFNEDPIECPQILGSRVDALFMNGKLIINECSLKAERWQ